MRTNIIHTCILGFCLANCPFVTPVDVKRIAAENGVCEDVQTGRMRCAMQSSDCKPQQIDNGTVKGEKWYSAYIQKQRGLEFCSCQDTSIGSCNSRCAPQQLGYCDHAANEIFHDATTLTHNDDCKCNTATYGACQDLSSSMNHFCALSPSDCEEDHHHFWVEPSKTKSVTGLDCSCKQVRVGGCIGKIMGFTCALSKDDCPWDVYYPPYSLKRLHGHTCNLCVVEGDDTSVPELDELDSLGQNDVKLTKNRLSGTAKIFIALTIILGIGGTAIGILFMKKRRRAGVGEVMPSSPSLEVQRREIN